MPSSVLDLNPMYVNIHCNGILFFRISFPKGWKNFPNEYFIILPTYMWW